MHCRVLTISVKVHALVVKMVCKGNMLKLFVCVNVLVVLFWPATVSWLARVTVVLFVNLANSQLAFHIRKVLDV